MDKTAKHDVHAGTACVDVISVLDKLDVQDMSFVQLKRLHNALQKTSQRIVDESARRTDVAGSGDTVKIQSPKL